MEVQHFDTRVQKGWGHAERELSPFVGLSALSKVYEKVMYDQLYNTFCRHLSQNLSGFLKNHSCCTALLKMTEDLRRSLDNRESAMAVAVDLSKAFDSINHSLLLTKFKTFGLNLPWFSQPPVGMVRCKLFVNKGLKASPRDVWLLSIALKGIVQLQ